MYPLAKRSNSVSDNCLVLPGHMEITTIAEEKERNPFGEYFLTPNDWCNNIYFGMSLEERLEIPIDKRA